MRRTAVTAAGIVMLVLMTAAASCSNEAGKKEGKVEDGKPTPQQAVEALKAGPGIFAVIDTSMGRIVTQLYPEVAPEGVANFTGLAEGTKEFLDPMTRQPVKKNFYDGLTFHRVIPGFMIQGGCPLGSGTGGPGYRFKNEVSEKLQFDKPGRLAYANAGKDTNGSQFFITHAATPWLNGNYTIFGQTLQGQDVVDKIGSVEKGPNDRPVKPVMIDKISIVRIEEKKKDK